MLKGRSGGGILANKQLCVSVLFGIMMVKKQELLKYSRFNWTMFATEAKRKHHDETKAAAAGRQIAEKQE